MLKYRRDHLHIENVPVDALVRKYGTPLFVYSKTRLIENYRSFDRAFARVPHCVCYAVKANSNGSILSTLAAQGAGADITSGGELFRALEAGFPADKIVYAGIGKTTAEIEYALIENIRMFNVESMEELGRINRLAVQMKKKAAIAFRVNPNVDPHTHKYITTGKSGNKFGIPYGDVVAAYEYAAKLPGIDVAGIHCHIGSQITETGPFHLAAERVSGLMERLARKGITLSSVNLGGGLGITYSNEEPPTPAELSRAVLPTFKDFKGTFLFEPGRYIVGNTGILVVKVIYRKHSGGKNFIIVNGGMNDLIRPTLYEAYHHIVPVLKTRAPQIKVDVVGPICESGDFLGKDRLLPFPEQDECLAVQCAGAYGLAMSSQYNSRLRAAEVMVDGSRHALIRKRETYKDLTAAEIR